MKLFKKLISLTLVLVMILAMSMSNRVDVSATMLSIPEEKAYLLLNGYTDEEVKNMPLEKVLSLLKDKDGNQIEIPSSAKVVWAHYKDENGNLIHDEYHELSRNETVDLTEFEYTTGYTMELIVGSGNQLDAGNKRYIVRVYLTNTITEKLNYELYTQDSNGTRTKVVPKKINSSVNTQGGVTLNTIAYLVPNHVKDTEYYLGITSQANEHPNVELNIYTLEEYQKQLVSGTGVSLSDKLLNQDMNQKDAGYKSTFEVPTSIYDLNNLFFFVYTEKGTNKVIGTSGYQFVVIEDMSYIDGELRTVENDKFVNNTFLEVNNTNIDDYKVDFGSGSVTGASGVEGKYYMLKNGYSEDDEYYFALNAHSSTWTDDANGHVVKAVEGHYNSLNDAANQEDIKDQLIPVNRNSTPYGYKANYNYKNGGKKFTVFFDDNTVFKFDVRVMAYNAKYDENAVTRNFDEAPVVGEKDPWFRINGAIQNDKALDTYVVENGKNINMDTLYGYGYQTIFINDKNVDLSKLKPTYEVAKNENGDDRAKAYVGSAQISGESQQDFSKGSIYYSSKIDDKYTKNYNVTFVKKESGPKLYVNGPSSRAIFLDEYFEYKHDILIANVGDKPLTGLKVKLDATNVKLDDYWTVGGNNNDTLDAFTTTTVNSKYGQLNNLAKIRLLPDGDGEIKGTLTISADGQEDQVIKLSGRASNPTIITDKLDNAVKYVPYSYLVSTDNMNDWNSVKFSLESGTLPEGLTLNENTGEIYGVAQKSGTYSFRVKATYGRSDYFEPSYQDLTLIVDDNTNKNVFEASDEGYTIKKAIGEEVGTYNYVLDELEDTVFTSYGENDNFVDVWINGQKLDVSEYERESGSTKLTIKKQTLEKRVRPGNNTIAQEFREEKGDKNSKLRRTAQNFVVRDKTQLNKVINLISKIPSKVTLNNKQQIVDARKAYNQLSATDKKDVTNYDRLVQAEKAIAQLEKIQSDMNEAKKVDKLIDLIPTKVTLKDKQSVENARNAYNNLSSSQKEYVTKYQKLLSAEEMILSLEKEDETIHNVTFVGILKDKKGNSLSDKIVELHSTVKSGKTDENGSFLFNSVDFGKHTIYVKDAKGNMIAQKEFEIREGKEMSIVNDIITVDNHSIFTLNIVLDGNKLSFNKIEKGNKAPTIEVKYGEELVNGISITNHSKNRKNGLKTGDETKVLMWVSLSIMSLIVILMILRFYLTKKKII